MKLVCFIVSCTLLERAQFIDSQTPKTWPLIWSRTFTIQHKPLDPIVELTCVHARLARKHDGLLGAALCPSACLSVCLGLDQKSLEKNSRTKKIFICSFYFAFDQKHIL